MELADKYPTAIYNQSGISRAPIQSAQHLADRSSIFSVQDILEAIDQYNFKNAIGPDGFDGLFLKKRTDLKLKAAKDIAVVLNINKIP